MSTIPAISPATATRTSTTPVASVAPPLVSAPAPAANPSWYGKQVGRQHRGLFSATGSVNIYAGRTFPTVFTELSAAMDHAHTRTIKLGAVGVMEQDGRFYLTRLYNAEYAGHGRYEMRQSDFSRGFGRIDRMHPALRAIIDATGSSITL